MKVSAVASRYAKALFDLATENRTQEKVFADLRAIDQLFTKDADIQAFLQNPMVKPDQREAAIQAAFAGKGLAKETFDTLLLLARNERLNVFSELVAAYEVQADNANNVARGDVRSATTLGPDERKRIEETVEKVLKKKVILNYKVDPSVIGGLIAQVGSYTFDDTISSHLRRMNEEIKRRTV